MRTSQVIDHLTTMLADIADALVVIEEFCGEPSPDLADAVEIQRSSPNVTERNVRDSDGSRRHCAASS